MPEENTESAPFVELIIPVAAGRTQKSIVCVRRRLGWMKINRETKLEWPGPTLRCRDRNAHAWAVICGPDDLVNAIVNDIMNCAAHAAVVAGIAAIIASPSVALPVFAEAFKACIIQKIGDQVQKLSINLEVTSETTDWGAC